MGWWSDFKDDVEETYESAVDWVEDAYEAVVETAEDVYEDVVDVIERIVEFVVESIMSLLGYDPDQTIEYYDVENIPLFPDADTQNPLINAVTRSVLNNTDISGELIYANAFSSLKKNLNKFIAEVDASTLLDGFPQVTSFILYVDHDTLADVLYTLEGEACTIETAKLGVLAKANWVQYWLQENHDYDVGEDLLDGGYSLVTTTPIVPSSTFGVVSGGGAHTITITDEVATADECLADQRWHLDLTDIVYTVGDVYLVGAYNDDGVSITLPYTVPDESHHTHYTATYYKDSTPSRTYMFIYEAGTGVYADLDVPPPDIELTADTLKTFPAIPLRLNNQSFNTFDTAYIDEIREMCDLLSLDADELISAVMNDSGVASGDIDHVYLNFGVRMWDTSQGAMKYLFLLCSNIYSSQVTTKAIYDAAVSFEGEIPLIGHISIPRPSNNLIVLSRSYEYAFQFAYIEYASFTLAEIDADTGSVENGIYYSDLSKFNADGNLAWPYYTSSGKGTYNVGFVAITLDEVAAFLIGEGIVNPGDTSTEAAEWLQVTSRMRYTEDLEDADGNASTQLYLTPDQVYENASGTLRVVRRAAEATTAGQSITYYHVTSEGLDSYTMVAPIGVLNVKDGATGQFRLVKFNLGAPNDLMVPFIYNFVQDLPNHEITKLFLAGTHISIYLAHYEEIEISAWLILLMVALVVVAIVVTVVTWGTATGPVAAGISAILAGTATVVIVQAMVVAILQHLIVSLIIKLIIVEVAKDNPELAIILAVAASMYLLSTRDINALTIINSVTFAVDNISTVVLMTVDKDLKALEEKGAAFDLLHDERMSELEEIERDLYGDAGIALTLLSASMKPHVTPGLAEDMYTLADGYVDSQFVRYAYSDLIQSSIEVQIM